MILDILQTIASIATAGFTFGSLLYLRDYVEEVQKQTRIANKNFYEEARPVVMLVEIRRFEGRRVAILKNTGRGVAFSIHRHSNTNSEADDNVIAPQATTRLYLPEVMEAPIFEIRYKSVTGKEFSTHCGFAENGRPFNDFRRRILDSAQASAAHVKIQSSITLADMIATASRSSRDAKVGEQNQPSNPW